MFHLFNRIDNQSFEIVYSHKSSKYPIKVKCSSIKHRNFSIPFNVCNSNIKTEIQSGIVKICQVLDGMHYIKTLEYKKYENVIDKIRKEISNVQKSSN